MLKAQSGVIKKRTQTDHDPKRLYEGLARSGQLRKKISMNQDVLVDDGILEYQANGQHPYAAALAPISQNEDSREQEEYYDNEQVDSGEEQQQHVENTTNI